MNANDFKQTVRRLYFKLFLFFFVLIIGASGLVYKIVNPSFLSFSSATSKDYVRVGNVDINDIKNGIHIPTGFKAGKGLNEVVISCTPCHSAKLVTQNRATKAGWIGIIRWMQATQNLWDLGENESVIVDYLAAQYAPEEQGRRTVLKNIEWYDLNEE